MLEITKGRAWLHAQSPERVQITSFDGLRLSGLYLPCDGAKATLVFMHGYRSDVVTDISCAAEFYHGLGLNILTVSQRAHGGSDGRYISFGVKERYDCKAWAEYIDKRVGGEIVIGGASMGATTALMASGLELPSSVKCISADCGFTSAHDVFAAVLKRKRVPFRKAVLPALTPLIRLIAGWDAQEYSTLTAMKTNKLPIFFAHGDSDKLVPPEMSVENYEACAAEKELLIVRGAGHAQSYLADTDAYQKAVTRFLTKYILAPRTKEERI
jgi:fermentation-respiration switch protein FrsA (DUF1100 family)